MAAHPEVARASANPEDYKKACGASAAFNRDLEDIYGTWDSLVKDEDWPYFETVVRELVEADPQDARALTQEMNRSRKVHRRGTLPRKSELLHVLSTLVARGEAPEGLALERLLVKKATKSLSGVLVITVLTSPYPKVGNKVQRFSCEWNCYYCPNEPGQPRSYLHDEPSVLRANRNHFDAVMQFTDRAATLAMNGHPVDKIELLVLGGTWTSYPHEYQEEFIRDLFYAANTFFERPGEKRERLSLDDEKAANETARVKIIGITLETRPDCIDDGELQRMRRYGCTRVQIGMQHTDDSVLRKINRGCTSADIERAIHRLKDACYKLDIHIMPNLPGSSAAMDREMFQHVLESEAVQADQWKIYPCEVTPWTVIKKWYETGEFVPYPEEDMVDLLLDVLPRIHPWIRVNRVVRDIPSQYILGGVDRPNLRQDLDTLLRDRGILCRDIRAREVKGQQELTQTAKMIVREYHSSKGREFFISYETPDQKTILGFARLRICRNDWRGESGRCTAFPELNGAALVRELHVYGQLTATTASTGAKAEQQHVGLGSQLMARAEVLAARYGKRKVAVISGVGVRNYYRRIGYELEPGGGEFMVKRLPWWWVLLRHRYVAVFIRVLGTLVVPALACFYCLNVTGALASVLS